MTMSDASTPAALDEIERLRRDNEILRADVESVRAYFTARLDYETDLANARWTCFFCGEHFSNKDEAAHHFGRDQAACVEKLRTELEKWKQRAAERAKQHKETMDALVSTMKELDVERIRAARMEREIKALRKVAKSARRFQNFSLTEPKVMVGCTVGGLRDLENALAALDAAMTDRAMIAARPK